MEIISRLNKTTNVEEKYLLTTGVLRNIETTSRTTKDNKKPFGFFNATIGGAMASGIAYDAVAENVGRENLVPGAEVQVEALLSDVKAGHNNRWKIALTSHEQLSEGITDFLNSL